MKAQAKHKKKGTDRSVHSLPLLSNSEFCDGGTE
jgi:hypothetical protein